MACSLPITLLSLIAISSLSISPALCSTHALFSSLGGKLKTGESLVLNDYTLTMQADCELILCKGKTTLWSSNTWLKANRCYLQLKPEGELFIFGYGLLGLVTVWRSYTRSSKINHALVLKYDGTAHIYGPNLWVASNATTTTYSNSLTTPTAFTARSTMWSNDIAPIGVILVNDEYKLELLDTCDLILTNTRSHEYLWHSGSIAHSRDCYVTLAADGELLINYSGGVKLWGNGAKLDNSDYVLALQPDGKLVVYGPSIWVRGKPTVVVTAGNNDENMGMAANA